ncbi:glycosyltransferase family 25 protein [Bizionia sp. KMM 8389]
MSTGIQEADISSNTPINAIIYIINLDRAVERRKFLEQELLKTDIPYKFISAIDKTTLSNINHQVKNKYKRDLIPAELGCYLSHVTVKELFLKSSYDFAIILEDDIRLMDDFDSLIKKAILQQKTLAKSQKWDVLKLASHGRKKLFKINQIDTNYDIYSGSVGITTMAAIWSRKGAESFLKQTIKDGVRVIKMPIDCALQQPWKYHLKIDNIVPNLVAQQAFESQIRPPEKLKSNFFKRLNYEGSKVIPRVSSYISTWLFRRS